MAKKPEQAQRPGGAAVASASPAPSAIRVLDTALVHPSPPSPEKSIPLTFYDVYWLNAPPVQCVYFYRLAHDADVDAVVYHLKCSLSQVIREFYPLAGRLRLTPGTANRYELYYHPGNAVTFTVADYDGHDVENLATDEPREVSKVYPLAPPLPKDGAVLAVQATVLQSGRLHGLTLGVTVHHAACDGAAYTHFLHTWAATCTGAARPPPPPPVIDRTLIPDPSGLYDAFYSGAALAADEIDKMSHGDQLFATFVLCKEHLQRVKDVVATAAAVRGVASPPRCSSLVAAMGLVWSCYQRAKPVGVGDKTCLLFTVDYRSRMMPPVPDNYFGNCLRPALAIAYNSELVEAGAAGLWSACAAVSAAIEEAASEVGAESMVLAKKRAREAAATMGILTVAGSPRFRFYELDMGFGRPAKVEIMSVVKTGAIAVVESRAGAGDGMEMSLSLSPDGMDAFQKCFADATARLGAVSSL